MTEREPPSSEELHPLKTFVPLFLCWPFRLVQKLPNLNAVFIDFSESRVAAISSKFLLGTLFRPQQHPIEAACVLGQIGSRHNRVASEQIYGASPDLITLMIALPTSTHRQ
jgi:hypothetical protein